MDDVYKMDSAALTREIFVISYAVFTTLAILGSLYYFLDLLDQYEERCITAIDCSRKLNFVLPFKVCLHIHCSLFLLIYRHPELFFLNLRMLIWHFMYLPAGYPPDQIEQPERLAQYRAQIWRHIYFFILALTIYTYCLSVPAKLKVAELEKENMKHYRYQGEIHIEGEDLLFGMQI